MGNWRSSSRSLRRLWGLGRSFDDISGILSLHQGWMPAAVAPVWGLRRIYEDFCTSSPFSRLLPVAEAPIWGLRRISDDFFYTSSPLYQGLPAAEVPISGRRRIFDYFCTSSSVILFKLKIQKFLKSEFSIPRKHSCKVWTQTKWGNSGNSCKASPAFTGVVKFLKRCGSHSGTLADLRRLLNIISLNQGCCL